MLSRAIMHVYQECFSFCVYGGLPLPPPLSLARSHAHLSSSVVHVGRVSGVLPALGAQPYILSDYQTLNTRLASGTCYPPDTCTTRKTPRRLTVAHEDSLRLDPTQRPLWRIIWPRKSLCTPHGVVAALVLPSALAPRLGRVRSLASQVAVANWFFGPNASEVEQAYRVVEVSLGVRLAIENLAEVEDTRNVYIPVPLSVY